MISDRHQRIVAHRSRLMSGPQDPRGEDSCRGRLYGTPDRCLRVPYVCAAQLVTIEAALATEIPLGCGISAGQASSGHEHGLPGARVPTEQNLGAVCQRRELSRLAGN